MIRESLPNKLQKLKKFILRPFIIGQKRVNYYKNLLNFGNKFVLLPKLRRFLFI